MINLQEILQLSPAERLLVIEKIWESINTEELEPGSAHKRELDSRLARYKDGKTKFCSWEAVQEDLRK